MGWEGKSERGNGRKKRPAPTLAEKAGGGAGREKRVIGVGGSWRDLV
jgi:hypothetical protein